jgi:D-alanyl-lipoteichoic acid acyltransferase DltB (MBOAT superfamily)
MLRAAGLQIDPGALNLVVPIGISFFTLQRLSYTIEIYRKRFAATRDPVAFFTFSCFFPLLMSGPIERATQLLPQFLKTRSFDLERSKDALRLILWGLFKKIVIADNFAGRVGFVFTNYDRLAGIDLGAGAFLFAIQLYADFSGYSDIVLGISRLFGFRVTRNFAYPYFSRDMAEYWRRWHVSLSAWFRDYIFTPLTWNVNLKAHLRRMGIVLLTFTASGLWHGASWTFIVWGVLNGLGFVPLVFGNASSRQTKQIAEGCMLPSVREGLQMVLLFAYVWVAWIFFRAASLEHALRFLAHMLTHTWIVLPGAKWLLLLAAAFLLIEWVRREKEHPLVLPGLPAILRWTIYCALSLAIYYFGHLGHLDFIYTHF